MSWLQETHGTKFELTRHFFTRMFDGEWSGAGGQRQRLAVSAFALFLPAGMLLVREGSMNPRYAAKYRILSALPSPDAFLSAALADQLALLTLLFAVTGLLAVLQWSSLFPSTRDCLALAGLPVRPRQVFAARFGAVVLFSTGLAAAMNLLPALIAPIEFAGRWQKNPSYAVNMVAEGVACSLGCLFVMFAIVALHGLLLNALPGRLFGRISTFVQGFLIAALLLTALYSWSIEDWTKDIIDRLQQFGAWLPPMWFAGLHEYLLGDRDTFLTTMAGRAVAAIACAVAAAVVGYAVSYRRYRTLLIENPVLFPAPRPRRWSVVRLIARKPRQEAVMDFMATALARSKSHRLIWLAYLGGTAAILLNSSLLNGKAVGHWADWRQALQFIVHFWPLAASVTLINGFRHVLSVPVELPANWMFRITESQGRAEWMQAVERFVLICTVIPIYAAVAPVAVWVLGWGVAARLLILQLLASLTIFEFLFYGWQRLPFTCSYVPGKRPLVAIVASYVAVLCAVVPIVAIFIAAATQLLELFTIFVLLLVGVWIWARRQRRDGWGEARLEYQDLSETVPNLGIRELTPAKREAVITPQL